MRLESGYYTTKSLQFIGGVSKLSLVKKRSKSNFELHISPQSHNMTSISSHNVVTV